ncbi:cyclophilin-like fold protein [Streptomyces sp. NPDC020597]|uniref:cyclophilin-like fold protein n=1 Tax=unclassified Streptomyces TaxID=2593676 RepID=UPI003791EFA3
MAYVSAADDHSHNTPEGNTHMRIRLTVGETVLNAPLDDNATARDFASLLPLTLQMNDLFKREKYAHLPRFLAAGGKPRYSYEIGNTAYWPPGPDITIFHDHDGQSIPAPGIVILGEIDSGADALKNYDGAVDVTIEAVD